jgi:hypothetical protein
MFGTTADGVSVAVGDDVYMTMGVAMDPPHVARMKVRSIDAQGRVETYLTYHNDEVQNCSWAAYSTPELARDALIEQRRRLYVYSVERTVETRRGLKMALRTRLPDPKPDL